MAFDQEYGHAIRVRGRTLTGLSKRAGVSIATASAAARGQQLNVTAATRLARALAAAPIIPELKRGPTLRLTARQLARRAVALVDWATVALSRPERI